MPNTSALFVATPAAGELDVEDAHITLTYFGEAESLDSALTDELRQVLSDLANNIGPFTADVAGTAVLGADKATVLLIESAELVMIYQLLLEFDSVREAQQNAEKQFPWWIPHATTGYDSALPEKVPTELRIDSLGFWIAGDQESYPLQTPGPDLTAALSVPQILCEQDLAQGIRAATLIPGARWYVAKRAVALGAADRIPQQWSLA
jgi:2'-5' RNA ligase